MPSRPRRRGGNGPADAARGHVPGPRAGGPDVPGPGPAKLPVLADDLGFRLASTASAAGLTCGRVITRLLIVVAVLVVASFEHSLLREQRLGVGNVELAEKLEHTVEAEARYALRGAAAAARPVVERAGAFVERVETEAARDFDALRALARPPPPDVPEAPQTDALEERFQAPGASESSAAAAERLAEQPRANQGENHRHRFRWRRGWHSLVDPHRRHRRRVQVHRRRARRGGRGRANVDAKGGGPPSGDAKASGGHPSGE